jgi:hypothetical protein
MSFFKKKNLENRKAKQALSGGWIPVGGGNDIRKGCRRVKMVKNYIHMYVNRK